MSSASCTQTIISIWKYTRVNGLSNQFEIIFFTVNNKYESDFQLLAKFFFIFNVEFISAQHCTGLSIQKEIWLWFSCSVQFQVRMWNEKCLSSFLSRISYRLYGVAANYYVLQYGFFFFIFVILLTRSSINSIRFRGTNTRNYTFKSFTRRQQTSCNLVLNFIKQPKVCSVAVCQLSNCRKTCRRERERSREWERENCTHPRPGATITAVYIVVRAAHRSSPRFSDEITIYYRTM